MGSTVNLRFVLIVFFALISVHAHADDGEDCAKASGETKLAACTRAIESGRWQGADLSWAYNNRGIAWVDQGDLDHAIADYTEAIRLDPKHVKAFNNRGNAWRKKGDYDKDIADCNEAIRLDPQYATAFNNRGLAWDAKGDLDRAIADYTEAIRLDPKYVKAYNNRGIAWGDQGDLDRAIADYTETIRLDPKNITAFKNRGAIQFAKGEFAASAADFAESQRLKQDSYSAIWLYLARARNGSDAREELTMNTNGMDGKKWPAPVVALYLDKTKNLSVNNVYV